MSPIYLLYISPISPRYLPGHPTPTPDPHPHPHRRPPPGAAAQLERCLPALNGITYTSDAARLFVLRSGSLPQLLSVFAAGVPAALQEYALRVLVNLTYSKEAELQLLAAQQGALGEPSPWP